MKKIGYIFLFFLFVSCSTQKQIFNGRDYSKGIVYVLPGNVQKLLSNKKVKDVKNIYFVLQKTEDMKFRIYQVDYNIPDKWIQNSNRYVAIVGELYPLLFDFDEYFANTETAEEFLADYKAGIYQRTQKSKSLHNLYHIDFTIKGDVLYEGY